MEEEKIVREKGNPIPKYQFYNANTDFNLPSGDQLATVMFNEVERIWKETSKQLSWKDCTNLVMNQMNGDFYANLCYAAIKVHIKGSRLGRVPEQECHGCSSCENECKDRKSTK